MQSSGATAGLLVAMICLVLLPVMLRPSREWTSTLGILYGFFQRLWVSRDVVTKSPVGDLACQDLDVNTVFDVSFARHLMGGGLQSVPSARLQHAATGGVSAITTITLATGKVLFLSIVYVCSCQRELFAFFPTSALLLYQNLQHQPLPVPAPLPSPAVSLTLSLPAGIKKASTWQAPRAPPWRWAKRSSGAPSPSKSGANCIIKFSLNPTPRPNAPHSIASHRQVVVVFFIKPNLHLGTHSSAAWAAISLITYHERYQKERLTHIA